MAKLVVGDVNVEVEVDDYGSTHDEELMIPLTLMVDHPGSNPSWKTKKLMYAGIIGMTAAVASSALLFLSIMDFSKQESSELSFLLHASVGNDNTCVPASGPWPTNSVSQDDDSQDVNGASDGPYVTCYSFQGTHCWSHSYYDSGDWKPCTPNGFGERGWVFDSPTDDITTGGDVYTSAHDTITLSDVATCGTGCTEFSSDVPPYTVYT